MHQTIFEDIVTKEKLIISNLFHDNIFHFQARLLQNCWRVSRGQLMIIYELRLVILGQIECAGGEDCPSRHCSHKENPEPFETAPAVHDMCIISWNSVMCFSSFVKWLYCYMTALRYNPLMYKRLSSKCAYLQLITVLRYDWITCRI